MVIDLTAEELSRIEHWYILADNEYGLEDDNALWKKIHEACKAAEAATDGQTEK